MYLTHLNFNLTNHPRCVFLCTDVHGRPLFYKHDTDYEHLNTWKTHYFDLEESALALINFNFVVQLVRF